MTPPPLPHEMLLRYTDVPQGALAEWTQVHLLDPPGPSAEPSLPSAAV